MDAKAARRRHEDRLLSMANVTAVGTGRDEKTGDEIVMVYVTRKVPLGELNPRDIVPAEIDGVPVRVVEAGEITAQGAG